MLKDMQICEMPRKSLQKYRPDNLSLSELLDNVIIGNERYMNLKEDGLI